jgi:hypothetical protein
MQIKCILCVKGDFKKRSVPDRKGDKEDGKRKKDDNKKEKDSQSAVEATSLGLKTKSGLRPNSSISTAYIHRQLPNQFQSLNTQQVIGR